MAAPEAEPGGSFRILLRGRSRGGFSFTSGPQVWPDPFLSRPLRGSGKREKERVQKVESVMVFRGHGGFDWEGSLFAHGYEDERNEGLSGEVEEGLAGDDIAGQVEAEAHFFEMDQPDRVGKVGGLGESLFEGIGTVQ